MIEGTRLLVLVPYPLRSAPGQRFRFEQYLATWEAAGIEVAVRPLFSAHEIATLYEPGRLPRKALLLLRAAARRTRDVFGARRFDVAFVYREAFPIGYPVIERVLALLGVPYIFDLDDSIWLPASTEANRAFRWLKMPAKAGVIAKHAALVTAGNRHIERWARGHTDRVLVVPTSIDTDRYQYRPHRDAGNCVGWSGSPTTIAHLRTIDEVLADLQKLRGLRLRVIGDGSYFIPGAKVEALPWNEETEIEDLAAIDIGIMPLPDDDWSRGKCGLKALQYMALGIPTVMSPVGVNVDIAEGGAALLAGSTEEWRRTLLSLLDAPGRRAELSRLGRERVEREYSQRSIAPLYLESVRLAASRRRRRRRIHRTTPSVASSSSRSTRTGRS